jgi:hypothetical protein
LKRILKSILKTAADLLEQSDHVSGTLRDAFSEGVGRAADSVADLHEKARGLYGHEDHTIRNVISFAAGVGVGVGVAILCTPASGREVRDSIGERAKGLRTRVRNPTSPKKTATGTEGI